jgi:hypothetical protein
VQRSFGPLQCRRIGVEWPANNPDKVLDILFEGDVSLGALAVELDGLSLGIRSSVPAESKAIASISRAWACRSSPGRSASAAVF